MFLGRPDLPARPGGLATVEVPSDSYRGRSASTIQSLVLWGEPTLVLAVVVAVQAFAVGAARDVVGGDWGDAQSFARAVGRALLVGIGLELA